MADKTLATPAVVGEILEIDVADIMVGDRLRPIDPDWVRALAGIINAEGQRTPIEVCRLPGRKGFTLVAGGHRLEAIKSLGWLYVNAIVVDADKAERRAREISENLWRKGLDPIDRATFVAELVTLHKLAAGIDPAKDGRAASAAARWQNELKTDADDATATMAVAYGWDAEVAERLNLSSRTIRRELTLHKRLLPGVVELLRGHPAARNAAQLAALAKMDAREQLAIARMMADGTARSVADALAIRSQRPVLSAEQKRFNTVLGTLGRMGAGERQALLDHIAGQYTQAMRRALAKAGSFDAE